MQIDRKDLQERFEKIEKFSQDTSSHMNEMGMKAISLIKNLIQKREQKKIEDLTKKLKS